MTIQKVRDFSGGDRTLSVDVDHSPVYELLLRLFVVGDDDCLDFEIGDQLSTIFDERASTILKKDLKALGTASEVWVGLIPLAHEVGAATIPDFIDHLAAMDPVELRTRLLNCPWIEPKDKPAAATVAAVAGGDLEAWKELAETAFSKDKHEGLRYLLEMEPERTRSTIVEVLRRYAKEVFTEADELAPLLAKDAQEKSALAARLPADRAIEIATNGITVEVGADTSGVVLIPAFSARPWVIITETGSTKILCYGASVDIEEDPDAPPAWVVKVYKALGDEKRLRILGVLREGPTSLSDLTQRLELSKSTVHHHLGMLRAAGLVLVTLGKDKEYSLRTDAVPQAGQLLEAYLTPATISGGKK
jgi:DNA-binding transcriptional ArsR family regulator